MNTGHQKSRLLGLLFAEKITWLYQSAKHTHIKCIFPIRKKQTYCASGWIVGHLIPCRNKHPVGTEVQSREIGINVPCSIMKDTATRVLVVQDLAISSVV